MSTDPVNVDHDAAQRLWVLRTQNTGYVLRVDDAGLLRHVHWGPPLTLDDARAMARTPLHQPRSFESAVDDTEELPCAGGLRFGVPALAVRFPDGTRDLAPVYDDHRIDEDSEGVVVRITMRERHYPLRFVLSYRIRPGTDVLVRSVELHHDAAGGDAIEVTRADSASWWLPARPDYRLSHVTGRWAAETQLHREPAPHAETVMTSRRGTTSHHANPWLMIDAGDADEERGEVWAGALAWSGSWRITAARTSDGRLGFGGGAGHDGLSWQLAPGESLTTPEFAGLYCTDGFGGASRRWHSYVRRHVLSEPAQERPVLYNSWEATEFDVHADSQRELAGIAASMGVELFVVDDGWFGGRRNDTAGLGDWAPSPQCFPDGLAAFAADVHALGMGFGLWVEPEMVNPDSDLYRAHPEWAIGVPHHAASLVRNQLVLDFSRPEVAQWAHSWLDELVGAHAIDFLKWDMNRPFGEVCSAASPADPDRTWRGHVEAVYSIMDRLRADHPGLRIESCSGGGARADLGILRRTDQVWTSDNTDAADRLRIQHGFSQLYPAQVMATWVTDSPNLITGRSVSLRFRCHVAMTGVFCLGADLCRMSEAERDELAEMVALYKSIRPAVQHGEQYRLGAPDGDGRTAVQYVGPCGEVVVFAFAPRRHFGEPSAPLRLTGLSPEGRYRDRVSGAEYSAGVLRARGLPVDLPRGDHASAVTVLDRL